MKILLLHAFPLDPSMWEAQQPVLEGHEVVAPSIYGRGSTMDAWADSLVGALDGPFDCCVGASMGGGCALALERKLPGLLGALVLSGAHAGPDAPERRPPVLVVVGDSDEMVSLDAARALAESAPRGRLDVIEDAGHLVSLDQPDRFNAVLARFLEDL